MCSCFWSVKGGTGVSTVAALAALATAGRARSTMLVDLDGDQPAILGIDEPAQPGMREWANATERTGAVLDRIATRITTDLSLVHRGDPANVALDPERTARELMDVANETGAATFVDLGRLDEPLGAAVLAAATQRYLVVRSCYLTLRAARELDRTPTGVVLIRERGRALGAADVEAVTGAPIVATIAWDSAIARAVDAGLSRTRIPRPLLRTLAHTFSR